MFRKLVSNLPFSPALIHEVGFYAQRLRQEDTTRRLTVIFVVLALVMQSLAIFSPPESANASSEQDIVRGGVSDLKDFLARYDANEDDLRDIYTAVGVTRDEIAAASPATVTATAKTYVMSRYGQLGSGENEASMSYQRSSGGSDIRYFSPLSDLAGSSASFSGWSGHSATLGWFAIIKANGSLATHGLPATLDPKTSQPSSAAPTKSIVAYNMTQNAPASSVTAKPLDKIRYTIAAKNLSASVTVTPFTLRISDALEYATLIDGGGGAFEASTGTLSWPQATLAPAQAQERTFVIQLTSSFPATSTGKSSPESYDCKLNVSFGNASVTTIDCPAAKAVESLFGQMPSTGIGINVAFGAVILLVVAFFAVRTRQLKREIRLIRHNLNTGILS